jgi:hypothetical protein
VALNILPIGMSRELKNFYSVKLLDRLVPALEHASHLSPTGEWKWEGLPPNNDAEFVEGVNKWREYYDKDVIE